MTLQLPKLLSTVCLVFAVCAFGHSTPASAEGLSLLEFQAGGIGVFQGGGNSFSGQVSWNPTYKLDSFWVRGDFAATYLKGALDNHFTALTYQALVGMNVVQSLGIEVGGGAGTWFSNGGTTPALSGNVVYGFQEKVFGLINRAYVGYERLFFKNAGSNDIKLGVGIAF